MLATHVIAMSLAVAEPATTLPPSTSPVAEAPAAIPAIGLAPAENPAETQQTSPEAEPQAGPAEDFDLEPDNAGLGHDPFEGFNRVSFKVSQTADKILIRPAAMVYRHAVPRPARDGVHNALSNINEPLVFLNDMLQLRPDRAIRTLGRFLLNSTLGIGGLFDVARRKPYNLPHHANSFGDTLGYYGVKPGPYIYLPIVGPTTLRDGIGSAEQLLPPMAIGNPLNRQDFQIATNVADGLDQRERADDDLKAMLRDAIDPYATFRANFLQNRAGEIAALKARAVEPGTAPAADDPLADPLADPAPPAGSVPAGH
ncbi:MAG: VacJ family lipoprotein [Novosphingobium sp.]|jgi:phospholipid-binding lipoprotein MlaA|nr:VacJ family lipoprotein [Novosphingobium sp.]